MRQVRFLAGVLLLAALAAVLGCANPAENKPEAAVAEPEQAPAAEASGQKYMFADGSKVGFVGSKVTGSHEGGFESFEGEILVADGDPAKGSVRVVIDVDSMWSDDDRLTGHLKSPDFFDVESFPTVTFASTSIVPEGDSFSVTGNLEMHGVTKSITFPASITVGPDGVAAQAEFFIKRFDFGIVYPGRADDLIRDEVVIKLDLQAVPAG